MMNLNEQVKQINADEYAMNACEYIAGQMKACGYALDHDEETDQMMYVSNMIAELATELDMHTAAIKAVCEEMAK